MYADIPILLGFAQGVCLYVQSVCVCEIWHYEIKQDVWRDKQDSFWLFSIPATDFLYIFLPKKHKYKPGYIDIYVRSGW